MPDMVSESVAESGRQLRAESNQQQYRHFFKSRTIAHPVEIRCEKSGMRFSRDNCLTLLWAGGWGLA